MSAPSAWLFLFVALAFGFAVRFVAAIGVGQGGNFGLGDALGVFVGLRTFGSRRHSRPQPTGLSAAEARAPDPHLAGRRARFRRFVSACEGMTGNSARSPWHRGVSFEGR